MLITSTAFFLPPGLLRSVLGILAVILLFVQGACAAMALLRYFDELEHFSFKTAWVQSVTFVAIILGATFVFSADGPLNLFDYLRFQILMPALISILGLIYSLGYQLLELLENLSF